jgi:hypothetical protein
MGRRDKRADDRMVGCCSSELGEVQRVLLVDCKEYQEKVYTLSSDGNKVKERESSGAPLIDGASSGLGYR